MKRQSLCRQSVHAFAESLETRRLFFPADPVSEEQLFIELLNKARSNPQQFAIDYNVGTSLSEFSPTQPLAVSGYLTDSAHRHAYEMADFNYFAHQSPITGKWPDQLAVDSGYRLNGWPPTPGSLNNTNTIESITMSTDASFASALPPLVALLNSTAGNPQDRDRLLDNFGIQQEIGVGHGVGLGDTPGTFKHYWVVHIAHRPIMPAFVTGVAFTDAVTDDDFYTPGEGIGGATITARNVSTNWTYTTTTFETGGYSIELPAAGTYDITASGRGFTVPVTFSGVFVGGVIKKDFAPAVVTHPVVTATKFNRSAPTQRIQFTFSENVAASLDAGDVTVTDLTHGGTVTVNPGVFYDAETNTAGFDFAGLPQLPDGRYRAVLHGSGVTNAAGTPVGDEVSFDFFMYRGDANGDGTVNFDDLLIFAKNYGRSGVTVEQGDFDFDGTVDFDDLLLISQRYGMSLSTTAPAATRGARLGREPHDVLA